MTRTACMRLETRHECPLFIISTVVTLVGIFTFLAARPLRGDTIYSGASVGSDGTIYGWGVTDATSMTSHTTHMNSSLTSPKGRVTSGYSSGGDYSRIDLSLPKDDNDTGTYVVTSFHWGYCPVARLWFYNGYQTQGSTTVTPYVQISLTTVNPNTIYIGGNPNSATITVTVFNQGMPSGSGGSVTLQVGTRSVNPQGAATVGYTPTCHVLTYAAGQASGSADTQFTVDTPSGSNATVNIQASLTNASGVAIKDPSPATEAQAALNVVKP